jgi:phosphatidylserine/phosphatidylglycerophosphate/cardiolipin synthase-like enzyme
MGIIRQKKLRVIKSQAMKWFSFLLLIFLATCASPASPPPPPQATPIVLAVYFSPRGGATEAIVQQLDKAKTSILVPAYSFTSAPIAKARVAAHERGVKVEILLDKSHLTERYTNAPFLAKSGIPVKIDSAHAIAHNKVMIIDGETVITGSFNFTKAAEDKNAENLLVVRDKPLAEKFTKNWQEHALHSEPYVGRDD